MDDFQHIVWHLERRERTQKLKTTAMIILGIPLSMVGPLTLATMFWFALRHWWRQNGFMPDMSWLELVVVLAIVTVPLLYRLEWRTRGAYLDGALGDAVDLGKRATPLGPWPNAEIVAVGSVLANSGRTASLFVEVFLLGPRLVIGGWRRAKLARRIQLHDRLRAARIIIAPLLRRERGMDTKTLVADERGTVDLLPILAYLTFYQWIGVGSGWERIWLYSESKDLLADGLP